MLILHTQLLASIIKQFTSQLTIYRDLPIIVSLSKVTELHYFDQRLIYFVLNLLEY